MSIRLAVTADIEELTIMLKMMAQELMPDHAVDDDAIYRLEILKYMSDETYYVYIDDKHRGFFMVKDDSEPIYVNMNRYIGTKVFIKKGFRSGRILKQFYTKLFEDFPDGDIIGLTEINSQHIPVLDKRHILIAKVYLLNKEA